MNNDQVGIYLRLSREDEKEGESGSITNQRALLMNYIKENKLIFVDEYIDDGVSGTTFNRARFKRLIEDINYLQKEYKSTAIITKDNREAEEIYKLIKDDLNCSLVGANSKVFKKDLVIIPAYVSKGLEFDSVIIYNDRNNSYKKNERNLLYVACTRCQHELFIYN